MTNSPIAEIFSQGEEVICGQVADTNAAWLSTQLTQLGLMVQRHTAVGDKLDDLSALMTEISYRSDLCICTGGLGPTIDDLTAEAAANAFNKPLILDQVALEQIKHYFSRRHKQMADSNRKQAYFPQSAIRLDNELGSAPGFAIKHEKCWFIFLPGVPSEMRHIFNQHVKPDLQQRFVLQANTLIAIKSIGIGESELQEKLDRCTLPNYVQLGFRASSNELQTKLLFSNHATKSQINHCVEEVVKTMGDDVYAIDNLNQTSTSLIAAIDQTMTLQQHNLTVLETASQGLIAAKCMGYDWLEASSFSRSTEKTLNQLDLPQTNSVANNAKTIANKLAEQSSSDIILVQLYEGCKEQLHDNRKSIVLYHVLITPKGMYQTTVSVTGSIKRKQNQAAIKALDLLRRYLQNKCH